MKDMDRPTGAKDRLAELVSAREKEMAPQRAVALPVLEKVARVLVVVVGVPIVIVLALAAVLLMPVAAVVACAGLAPSYLFSLLAQVINRHRHPAGLKIALSLLAFPLWLLARIMLVPSTAYLRIFFTNSGSDCSGPCEDAAPPRSSNGHRPELTNGHSGWPDRTGP